MHRHPDHGGGFGHNAAHRPAQWQTPHLADGDHHDDVKPEADFDLVEESFAESFPRASDPTSFLRLSGVPFCGTGADGATLRLLRVEFEEATDVGALTPRLGGEGFGYDPLPAKLVSRRRALRFVYHDGAGLRRLSLGEARALTPAE